MTTSLHPRIRFPIIVLGEEFQKTLQLPSHYIALKIGVAKLVEKHCSLLYKNTSIASLNKAVPCALKNLKNLICHHNMLEYMTSVSFFKGGAISQQSCNTLKKIINNMITCIRNYLRMQGTEIKHLLNREYTDKRVFFENDWGE
jgi:hypothetical protein